jgi:hypothetical protein
MKSTKQSPLLFFDWYLERPIYKDNEKFYETWLNEFSGSQIQNIDKVNHTITIVGDDDNLYSYKFSRQIDLKLNPQVNLAKLYIELGFQERFSNTTQINGYANFLKTKLNLLQNKKSVKDFPFLKSYLNQLNFIIDQFNIKKQIDVNISSFSFQFIDKEIRNSKLSLLYDLLSKSPAIIKGTKTDFIKAYSEQPIENKIQWLINATRNKKPSKASLLYFHLELYKKGLLSKNDRTHLYKKINYIYINSVGNPIGPLKDTYQKLSENPDQKTRIDNIISTL